MKAFVTIDKGYIIIKLPPGAQLAPKIKEDLEEGKFIKCGTEF